jgi:hypothetical protein
MYSNKISLKGSLLLLTSIGVISFVLNTPKAHAGGGDEPAFTDANADLIESTPQNQNVKFIPIFFDWSKWQTPTQNDQVVCREKDGNVVCVSSLQSQNLRWIQSAIPKI